MTPTPFPLNALGRAWWLLVLYGVLAVLFGVLAVARPVAATAGLVWAFGILAIAEGIATLVALFTRDTGLSKGWTALYALASLAFGVLAVIDPLSTAGALAILLAAWMVVAGIYRIVFAVRVRRLIRGEWLIALSGVLSVVLGVLFAIAPLAGAVVATLWVGIGALIYGVIQIVAGVKLRKFGRTAL